MAAHRYWRMYVHANYGDSQVGVKELEFRTEADIQTAGADETPTGTGSAIASDGTPSQAFDNDPDTTQWLGSMPGAWVGYDFGAGNEVDIWEVSMKMQTTTSRTPKTVAIEYSDDGVAWTEKWRYRGIDDWNLAPYPANGSFWFATRYEENRYTLDASADVLLRAGSYSDTHQTAADYYIKAQDPEDNNTREAVVQFDLGSLPTDETVEAVELSFWESTNQQAIVEVWKSTEHDFNESEATWHDKRSGVAWSDGDNHGRDLVLEKFDVGPSTTFFPLESGHLVTAVEDAIAYGNPLTLVLRSDADDTGAAGVYGRAGSEPEFGPRLRVTFGVPAVSLQLTATAVSASRIDISLTEDPPDAVVSRTLHRSTSSGFTPDEGNKIADLDTTSYTDSGLSQDTTYYYKVVALDAYSYSNELTSNEASATTLTLDLQVTAITTTTGQLVYTSNETYEQVEYQTTDISDVDYYYPIDEVVKTGEDRFSRTLTGLYPETQYRSRARHYDSSTATWSDWIEVSWETLASAPPSVPGSYFTYPEFGQPVSGSSAQLAWVLEAGLSVVSIEISELDDGVWGSWIELSGPTDSGVTFDSTGYYDGFYRARLTLDNGDVIEHAGFIIDNASVFTYQSGFSSGSGVTKYLNPQVPNYTVTGTCFPGGYKGHIGSNDNELASFGPSAPIELTYNRRAIVTAEFAAWFTGRGMLGTGPQGAEELAMGVSVAAVFEGAETDETSYVNVFAGIRHHFLSSAFATSEDPEDPFRNIAVSNEGQFNVSIGPFPTTYPGWTTWHNWQETIPVAGSWTRMDSFGFTEFCRERPYKLYLEIERPDPTGNPNLLRVLAVLNGPDHTVESGRQTTIIDQTVEVQRDTGEDYTIQCGHIAFVTKKYFGWYSEISGRFFSRYSAWADTDCGYPSYLTLEVAVDVDCQIATLTHDVKEPLDLIRWRVANYDDPSFSTPVVDSGWVTPQYLIDEVFGGATDTAYYSVELEPGTYWADVQIDPTSGDPEGPSFAESFIILGYDMTQWGGFTPNYG